MLPENAAYMVADTETSSMGGLVIQLAYNIYSSTHVKLRSYNRLLKLPSGETIQWGAFRVHGIGKRQLDTRGVATLHELRKFVQLTEAIQRVGGRTVFHNAQYDCAAITRTIARHGGREVLRAKDAFCTYRRSVGRVPMRDRGGKHKGASNVLLYEHLFKHPPRGNLHDAAVDIAVTAASYAEGCRRRWW